jgi:xanthine dehydrogenase accessory factor
MAFATAIDVCKPVAPPWRASGGIRAVLEAAAAAEKDDDATLALVVANEGSTYVRAGAMALFGSDESHVGWLSGGCLESEIAHEARRAAQRGRLTLMDIDTRDDGELLSGTAVGCRGWLRVALLPLRRLYGLSELVDQWRSSPLRIELDTAGTVQVATGPLRWRWQLPVASPPPTAASWRVEIASPPSVLCFGAGPESATLLPLLRQLGWFVTVAERRRRWVPLALACDRMVERLPREVWRELGSEHIDAALIMHHNFDLDREALEALAEVDVGFVGLLGPVRRREDLFHVLSSQVRQALSARLHSPVGIRLGGCGPEAIALSVAAQLQCWANPL